MITLESLQKTFTVYRSSAGSGKTRTLAREYLKMALRYRETYFRHILAVTFANKATQEMKDRILAYLHDFANDRPGELGEELKAELQLDDATFRERSEGVQQAILHGYAQFSISTIDAFFQRVIRSFTHESGLIGDYRLEVEHDVVLEEVINNLIDELGENEELTQWVVQFARENLANERAWDVRQNLLQFSREIFNEEFKEVEDDVNRATAQEGYFRNLLGQLQTIRRDFIQTMREKGAAGMKIIQAHSLLPSDFKWAGRYDGAGYAFFRKLAVLPEVRKVEFGSRVTEELLDVNNWANAKSPRRADVQRIVRDQLIVLHHDILTLYREEFKRALSAELALRNLYEFGLISDIARKLKEYKDENNIMLLADAPKFLNGVIQDSDTPFIYEKIGSFYRNFLIDEFQDTSGLQWKNFLPLLTNSLDQGYPSLIVGDVKQAIYRWRGGDLTLLQQVVEDEIGEARVDVRHLNNNFRSVRLLVEFNNAIFRTAASVISSIVGDQDSEKVYFDVTQEPAVQGDGFVHLSFLDAGSDDGWKTSALHAIPGWLEKLQEQGVKLKDIAILVRKNEEGQEIVSHMLEYRHSANAKAGYRYDVMSNESLRIDGASSVNLITAAMSYLLNPMDVIARAQLAFEFSRLSSEKRPLTEVFEVSNQVFFESSLPEGFSRQKASLKKVPLYELTENLIRLFHLDELEGEVAYLLAFQDLVLEFSSREKNDLGAFLEWWEVNRKGKSIQVSGSGDAVQILTVHKAKGLQFNYVLIPFCSWNLDHESYKTPLLWVTSQEPPFDAAGYLPVRYSGVLEHTFFAEAYQKEHQRAHLDNLNLLYVALTRAQKGMIISAPYSKSKTCKSVANLLQDCVIQTPELVDGWNNSTHTWTRGTITPSRAEVSGGGDALTLNKLITSEWREKLVIRQSSYHFFDDAVSVASEKIKYGIHLHSVLSRISYWNDTAVALEKMEGEGLVSKEERISLQQQMDTLFVDDQIRSWFSRPWQVRTEVPILLPGGKESRIDRLLIDGRKAVVIDFKTGKPMKSDESQVREYMDVLLAMNFYPVEGFLFYLRTGDVMSVDKQPPRKVRKKDRAQLDLGF